MVARLICRLPQEEAFPSRSPPLTAVPTPVLKPAWMALSASSLGRAAPFLLDPSSLSSPSRRRRDVGRALSLASRLSKSVR